jgi:hypothetical protein
LPDAGWKRWLRARAAFHQYSFRNQLLIAMQCPDATHVAGYKAWQKIGYQVRRGEKGIYNGSALAGKLRKSSPHGTRTRRAVLPLTAVTGLYRNRAMSQACPEGEQRPGQALGLDISQRPSASVATNRNQLSHELIPHAALLC